MHVAREQQQQPKPKPGGGIEPPEGTSPGHLSKPGGGTWRTTRHKKAPRHSEQGFWISGNPEPQSRPPTPDRADQYGRPNPRPDLTDSTTDRHTDRPRGTSPCRSAPQRPARAGRRTPARGLLPQQSSRTSSSPCRPRHPRSAAPPPAAMDGRARRRRPPPPLSRASTALALAAVNTCLQLSEANHRSDFANKEHNKKLQQKFFCVDFFEEAFLLEGATMVVTLSPRRLKYVVTCFGMLRSPLWRLKSLISYI